VEGKNTILKMEGISKKFPGVKALDKVHFELRKGEVHALAGENGAGKSTFMKILTGIYRADEGKIIYKGKEFIPSGPRNAQEEGISIIHQELNLMPDLSISENIFIGREPRRKSGLIDMKKMNYESDKLLKRLGLDISPATKVGELTVASRQMVEIAKALSTDSEVLILDEPTSALSLAETKKLFEMIRILRKEGVGIIYISHRMEEFDEIVDRVTVLRDGQYISTHNWKGFSVSYLIKDMVGREMEEEYPARVCRLGDVVFEVKGINSRINGKAVLENISFSVRSGEVLGIAGLMGAGRTELARAIIGADEKTSGEIYKNGKEIRVRNPGEAIRYGIAYLPEDRKETGLFLDQNVEFNITVASLTDRARRGIINDSEGAKISKDQIDKLHIKTPSIKQTIRFLSGGNQQKVLIARWLCKNCDVIIFDEPTRGIDVGAKWEVYNLMNEIASAGAGVIMISSEMKEVIGMSDRIIVMSEGHLTGELDAKNATQEEIMKAASASLQMKED
jgi:ABC-type sugar transport system, ATPase component